MKLLSSSADFKVTALSSDSSSAAIILNIGYFIHKIKRKWRSRTGYVRVFETQCSPDYPLLGFATYSNVITLLLLT